MNLTAKLAVNSSESFPKVFGSAELEGAYRFFGNPVVTPDGILSGHFEATRQRCIDEGTVLVLHDTTKFSFRVDGQRKGLGRLAKSGQTFFAHASLAITADGTRRPLGIAALKTWTRGEEPNVGERERWFEQVELAAARLPSVENVVHVMDREGDDYGLFARLVADEHRFIVRSMHNRQLVTDTSIGAMRLDDAIEVIEREVGRTASISKRVDGMRSLVQKRIHPSRSARIAKLAIGAAIVTLERPKFRKEHSLRQRMPEVSRTLAPSLRLNVVRVWEPNPPPDQTPIEWVLLTTESIATRDDITAIVDAYRARWTIEEFFKALKTGCAYESRQLEDYEGLTNALAVFAPIACRLLLLRSEARRKPDMPASEVIETDYLDVLRTLGRRPLPTLPSVRDVLLAIAALGGHIKYSGDPGWLTIARGHAELLTLTRGWRAAKLQSACDQR